MALRIQNKFPIDTKARSAVGVSIPFSNPAVFNSTYQTKDQIKSNLINYFMTNKGERVLNNSFGGDLRNTVFEQIDQGDIDNLKLTISRDVKNFFPTITLNNVDIYATPDLNTLKVVINYSVVNFGIEDTIQLTLT